MALQADESNLPQTDTASKLWTRETKPFKPSGTTQKLRQSFFLLLLGFLAASSSPGKMQVKSLLWNRHRRRIGGTGGISPLFPL